ASQSGYGVDYATQGAQTGFPGGFLNQNSQAGYSHFGGGNGFISQDYMAHGSQGLFTQAGFNDPSQDDSSHPLYSQPFTHYNNNLQTKQQPQGQSSQNHKLHYNG
ncbi:Regulator of nonsense transcripts 1-like protein, partial [Thalictrum thalictroides]